MNIQRWVGIAAGGLSAMALAFTGWVFGVSEMHYRGFPQPAPFTHPIPEDPGSIAHGQHLALTRGCGGCHGAELEGELMWGASLTPNLPAYAREHSPATIEAALRHGIGHDGRALYSMPAYNFMRLTDDDVAALIAYLRSAPVSEAEPRGERTPWHENAINDFKVRFAIALGQDGAIPKYLNETPPLARQNDPNPSIARGEYLAMTSCNECHGFDLRANAPWPTNAPDLIVVGAYSPEQFTTLMREGAPSSGAELAMMGPVARGRFVHWTDEEVDDLYAYLTDLSRRAVEAESQ